MAKNFTKVLCAFLAFVMCLGTVPAFAVGSTEEVFIPQQPEEVGNNYPLSKVLNEFKNDVANITLSIPSAEVEKGVDIVYIVGSFATNDDGTPNVEGDILISCLVETMTEIVEAGIPVKFGMVPFSADNVVAMPLTKFDETNIDELGIKIADALETCDSLYDAVNMENALIKAKKMFSNSDLKDNPSQQHLVMITSGFTYFFNGGENNEYASTVPVNYKGVNRLFFWNKAWQRARTNQTNTYPIPKGIVEAYNKTDKTMTLWDFYWSYIDQWVKADIAAGDKVVFNACTIESGSFLDWWKTGELVDGYGQTGYGKAVPASQVQNIENYVTLTAGANPLTDASAAHAIGYERAMWEAYEYAKENFMETGINFYPIYNALNYYYTNGNKSPESYGVSWTDQYIGHSFVDMLAGGEGKAVKYDKEGDKAFFEGIKKSIMYTVSNGSKVTDAIGYDATEGNFDFITDADKITLVFNDVEYKTIMTSSTVNADGKIIKASYKFVLHEIWMEIDPLFTLDYYYGDGMEGEYFDWNFHTDVSVKDRVSLTYNLNLVEKSSEIGTHTLDTNRFAVLYPVDSYGKEGIPHLFPVPEVEYEVNPYDVDIVLALGAGIAKYDIDYAGGSNTYDSIVSLVEPLVNQGINVKLGLVAVEHYTEKAMDLTVLTKENYKEVIQGGLETIQNMPAGPTNLEGVIAEAHAMLTAKSEENVPAANKFFYVIATGRTYCFDDAEGNPATTLNKVTLKGETYYYWGHYAWQSQRGRHTSLYLLPNGNDWDAYWRDVVAMNKADIAAGDEKGNGKYDYTMPGDYSESDWYVGNEGFFTNNSADAKAMGLATSRYGWIIKGLTDKEAIGSGANPGHAMAYDRGQYEAWVAYEAMKGDGINCYAICSESTSYQNGSPYIKNVAKYNGNTTMQVGHSFMNFLAGGEATLLFQLTDPNTGASEMAKNFFAPVDTTKLVKSTTKALEFNGITYDIKVSHGTIAYITVEAEGDVTYEWHVKTSGGEEYVSTIDTETYKVVMDSTYDKQEVYCIITDELGNKKTTDTVTFILSH